MEIISFHSPQYATTDSSLIDCLVLFDSFPSEIHYTCSATDVEPISVELFTRITSGEAGAIAPYIPPVESSLSQAKTLLAAGITITSNSAGTAVNGVYSATTDIEAQIQREALSLLLTDKFTNGGTTISWPDISGAIHVFPTPDVFRSFAFAVTVFAGGISNVQNGLSTVLPAASATIA